MFEREVKFIYDFNSNKVKKLGASATFTELLPLGIHPAILQYISAEIEYRVFEDRQTLLKHSMFDYSGPEIAKHFGKIADEIKKEKSFSTDFLSKVILHATSFNVNYLIRPNWSLKKLIFDTSESTSVAEITQILNYTYFYKHLTKVIRNFLDKKKLITLNKDEFGELLTKFDTVSMQSYGKDILDSAIKSMASFFNIGSMNQKGVPLQAIGVFLQEKKMTSHLDLLQSKLSGETKSKIEVNDLRNILLNQPMENVEYFEPAVEKEEDENILETEETIQPEPTEEILEETEPAHEDPVEDEVEEELIEEVEEKTEPAKDDIEIKLRANKEKEVSENEVEEPEEVTTEEPKEEIDDPMDYLGDQSDDGAEIILTVDDLEEKGTEFEEEPEIEFEQQDEDKEEIETGEMIDLEDEVEEPENIEEDFEIVKEDHPDVEELLIPEEDDSDLVIEDEVEYEIPPEPEDDYSYPKDSAKDIEEVKDEDELIEEKNETDIEDLENEIINEEIESEEDSVSQKTLFGDIPEDELLDNDKDDDEFISEFGTQNFSKRIDIADLLENRNMTKIIEVVFDYDMEEFANSIERICESSSRQEAFTTLQEIFEVNQVNPTSKEAQAFRDIISEYFDQN